MPVSECDSSCQVVLDPLPVKLVRSLNEGGKVRIGRVDAAVVEVMKGLLTGVEESVGGAFSRSNREPSSRVEIDPETSRDRSSSRKKRSSGEKKKKSRRRSTSSSSCCSDASRKKRKKHKRHHRDEHTEAVRPSPRVNPIFLWVKQDDTRIVEVLCEDYDKRNRIRLTKTAQGWRAIPRTERLYPTSTLTTTPLVKSDIPPSCHEQLISSVTPDTKERDEIPCDVDNVEKENRLDSVNNDCDIQTNATDIVEKSIMLEVKEPSSVESCHANEHTSDGEVEHESQAPIIQPESELEPVQEKSPEPEPELELEPETEPEPEPDLLSVTVQEFEDDSARETKDTLDLIENDTESMSELDDIIKTLESPPESNHLIGEDKDNDFPDDTEQIKLSSVIMSGEPDTEMDTLPDPLDIYTFVETPKTDVCEEDVHGNSTVLAEVDSGVDSAEKSSVDEPERESCSDSVDITEDKLDDIKDKLDECEEGKQIMNKNDTEENILAQTVHECDLEEEIVNRAEVTDRVEEEEDIERMGDIEEIIEGDEDMEETVDGEGEAEEDVPMNLVVGGKKQSQDDAQSKLSASYESPVRTDSAVLESSPVNLFKLPEGTTIQQTEMTARPAHQKDKTKYLQAMLSSCKRPSPPLATNQEAPLDLGVSKRTSTFSEPQTKKLKVEDITLKTILNRAKEKQPSLPPAELLEKPKLQTQNKNNSRLLELLSEPENSTDPLAQLKEVLSDPDLQVPDPLLVPRARLPALVASPAREIPRLLSQKSEALTYPKLLTDPDLLPVSLAHLQMLLQTTCKEDELLKYQVLQHLKQEQAACGLDSTTLNQMLWLPYLSHLEAAAMACGNNQDFLAMLNLVFPPSSQPNPYHLMSPLSPQTTPQATPVYDYKSQMEFNQTLALWNEAVMHNGQVPLMNNIGTTQMKNINNNNTNVTNNNLSNMNIKSQQQLHNYQETKFNPRSQLHLLQQQAQQLANMNPAKMTSARTSPISQSYQQQRQHRLESRTGGNHQAMVSVGGNYNFPQNRTSTHHYTTAGYQQTQNQRLSSVAPGNNYNSERNNQNYSNLQRLSHQSIPVSSHSTTSASGYYVPPVSSRINLQNLHSHHQTTIPKTTNDLHHSHHQQHQMSLDRLKSPPGLTGASHNLNSITTTANSHHHHHHHQQSQRHSSSHQQQLHHLQQTSQAHQQKQTAPEVPKLKVKQHLIDPNVRPKLLKFEDQTDMTAAHPHPGEQTHLWHPLFSSHQEKSYTSPWQWTTPVTVSGE